MKYLSNALSLGMLDCLAEHPVNLVVRQITLEQAKEWVEGHSPESVVGHADTALLLTTLLGKLVEMRRVGTTLAPGDKLLVAQYNGPRLPEGATSLPEGSSIRWIYVCVETGC
jgi:hypothetical protein